MRMLDVKSEDTTVRQFPVYCELINGYRHFVSYFSRQSKLRLPFERKLTKYDFLGLSSHKHWYEQVGFDEERKELVEVLKEQIETRVCE